MVQQINFIKVSGKEIKDAYKQRIQELAAEGVKELTNGNLHNVVRERLLKKYNGGENDIIENQANGYHYWRFSDSTYAHDFRFRYKQYFK